MKLIGREMMENRKCGCCEGLEGLNREPKREGGEINKEDLVCYCEGVSRQEIVEAIQKGASSVREVAEATGACQGAQRCEELNPKGRCCAIDILEILQESEG